MSDTEKTLSWILKGGLLLTPFIVLIVTRSLYFPFITGKNFLFRILVELLTVVWVYAALRFPRFRPRFSAVTVAVLAFVAAMGLATIFSISPYRSFWSGFERMEGYIGLLHLLFYFLLLGSVFTSQRDWSVFFHTSLAASVIVSLYGLLQLAGRITIHQGGIRLDATLGNATYLAAYLVFHLFFLIWFFLQRRETPWRLAYGGALVLELIVLYYTATRGGIIGFAGGLAVLGLLAVLFSRGLTRRLALLGGGLAIILGLLFFAARHTDFVQKSPVLYRFASLSFQETTTRARFAIWGMAVRGFQERPVIGWGQESFTYVFSKYYQPSLWNQEPWFDRAHNVFLDWLIAGGAVGLLAYLSMFAAAGWLLIKTYRRGAMDAVSAAAVTSLLAAHFFQIIFVFDNLTTWLLFFALLAYLHAISRPGSPALNSRAVAAGQVAGIAAASALILIPTLYFVNIKPIRAARAVLTALNLNQTHEPAGKVDALIETFRRGLALNTFGTTELREQVSQVAGTLLRDPAIAGQDKAKFLTLAAEELEAQRRDFPYDMRAKAFLGTIYASAGRPQEAIAVVNEALAVSDRRQQYYFVAAEAYLNAGEPERAFQVLSRAYELAPDYPEAAVNLGSVLILAGREAEAEEFFEKRFKNRIVPDEHFANAYAQRGSFKKSLQVWELIVRQNPQSAQSRASLGVAYARIGDVGSAVRELEESIRLEPRFKAQGEQIIQAIRSGQIR